MYGKHLPYLWHTNCTAMAAYLADALVSSLSRMLLGPEATEQVPDHSRNVLLFVSRAMFLENTGTMLLVEKEAAWESYRKAVPAWRRTYVENVPCITVPLDLMYTVEGTFTEDAGIAGSEEGETR